MKLWHTLLLEHYRKSVPDSLIRLSRSRAAKTQSSSSSHNGALPISENTIALIEPVPHAKDEAMPFIGGMELPYANPLDANDVSDSEQYQGCRMRTGNGDDPDVCQVRGPKGYLCTRSSHHEGEHIAMGCNINKSPCETWPQEQPRQEAQAATYKQLYGLPTDDKARKRLQIWTWLMEYFPDAILQLVEVSIRGNEQHNPGQPLHWARGKSMDQMNTAFRHQWDYGRGVKRDTDGQYHLAKAAWRLLAQLQLDIEEERRQNGDK